MKAGAEKIFSKNPSLPRSGAHLYTHREVGRNKPLRATARTGVSGKHLPISPKTPPRATRPSTLLRTGLDGLIPAYIRGRHSSVHVEMTLLDRLCITTSAPAWECRYGRSSVNASTVAVAPQRWSVAACIPTPERGNDEKPGIMKKRGALAEHPFGVLKHRAGMNHFLMRGLEKCCGEFSLMVLSYNFTRLLNILGTEALRDYCARRHGNTLRNVGYA